VETPKRSITFQPAFDRRDPDPKKNYGIHGVSLRFVLKGSKGAIQFVVYTNWHLPHVQEELDNRSGSQYPHLSCHPTPADLGYHAYKPHYDEQTQMEGCDVLPDSSGGCYYDGSSLNAEPVYERLLREGEDGVWSELEAYYKVTFREEIASEVD